MSVIELVMRQGLIDYLGELQRFCSILQSDVLTNDDICQLIGLGLIDGKMLDVAIFEISDAGTFTITGSFGARLGNKSLHVIFPLDTKSPAGAAMVLQRMQWLKNSEEMFEEFPESVYFPDAHLVGSLIALPISQLGRTIGCLLVEGEPTEYDPLLAAKLELIAAMMSHKISKKHLSKDYAAASKHALRGLPLTARETLVQEMMHDNHSNKEISESIGYSESTIRQDAVSLFAKLNVTNRKAAGKLYIAS